MNDTYKIKGTDAIRLAERDNLTIRCYANPIDDGGVVSIQVARQIAKEDAGLVYITVTPSGWWDGQRISAAPQGYCVSDYFTVSGMYLGLDDDGIEPTWDDASPARDALVSAAIDHITGLGVEARESVDWNDAVSKARL